MNKSVGFILLLLMFTNTMNAELANGKIEEFFIKNGIEERKIRIYYPNNNSVDDDTTFIIMNDGEELFLERDSWRGRTWRIDKSFDGLAKINKDPNVIIIAVQSAKKYKGKFFDNTRRYLELFPKEVIEFLPEGNKKKIYGSLADTDYPKFLVESVVPFIEGKFEINLDKNNLGIIGSSMGGLSALNTIIEYPDEFGFAGCLSTHWIVSSLGSTCFFQSGKELVEIRIQLMPFIDMLKKIFQLFRIIKCILIGGLEALIICIKSLKKM